MQSFCRSYMELQREGIENGALYSVKLSCPNWLDYWFRYCHLQWFQIEAYADGSLAYETYLPWVEQRKHDWSAGFASMRSLISQVREVQKDEYFERGWFVDGQASLHIMRAGESKEFDNASDIFLNQLARLEDMEANLASKYRKANLDRTQGLTYLMIAGLSTALEQEKLVRRKAGEVLRAFGECAASADYDIGNAVTETIKSREFLLNKQEAYRAGWRSCCHYKVYMAGTMDLLFFVMLSNSAGVSEALSEIKGRDERLS